MRRSLRFILVYLSAFLVPSVFSQSSTGSSTITADPVSLMVTAVCETAMDSSLDDYYIPTVSCIVRDQNGTVMGSGQDVESQPVPSAVAVVEFQGVAGMTYTVTAR